MNNDVDRLLLILKWIFSIQHLHAMCMHSTKPTRLIPINRTISFRTLRKHTHFGPAFSPAGRLWRATSDPVITSSR